MMAKLILIFTLLLSGGSLHYNPTVTVPCGGGTGYETVHYTFPRPVSNVHAYALAIRLGFAQSKTAKGPGRTFTLRIPFTGKSETGPYVGTLLGYSHGKPLAISWEFKVADQAACKP